MSSFHRQSESGTSFELAPAPIDRTRTANPRIHTDARESGARG